MSDSIFTWATVTAINPIRIRLDGDTSALGFTPETLVDPLLLSVDDRVRCEIANNRPIITGVSGGPDRIVEVPAGNIELTGRSSAPTGWLLCDGSAVSRTTYADLFAAIGTQFGSGNGSTTFNLPNLKGRVPVGIDTGQTEFDVRGETGGAKTVTLTAAESGLRSHWHQVGLQDATDGVLDVGAMQQSSGPFSGWRFEPSATSGTALRMFAAGNNSAENASAAHNNLQPYIALHFIIKT